MKYAYLRKLLFSLLFVCFGFLTNAQSKSEILNNTEIPIFYYGIDFTKTKLINDPAANPTDIVERQFAGLNALMINETKKYDIAGAFRRTQLANDLSYVNKRNEKADPDKLMTTNTDDFNRLKESDIQTLIKNFDGGGKPGAGLLFVVDALSKTKKAVSLWVVLFDGKTKKILMAKPMQGEVGMGFSFRNYWATGLKKIIDQIKKLEYSKWKSEQ